MQHATRCRRPQRHLVACVPSTVVGRSTDDRADVPRGSPSPALAAPYAACRGLPATAMSEPTARVFHQAPALVATLQTGVKSVRRDIAPAIPRSPGNAPGRNRTCDLALRRRALYPLSYRRFESVSLAPPRRAALPASAPTVLGRALPGKVACAKRETFHGDSSRSACSSGDRARASESP